jgi:hypothetical protein
MNPKFIHAVLPSVSRTVTTVKEGKTKTVVIPARVTIAWVPFSDTEIEVGLSWCSPGDQFSRHVGRQKAQGRLIANKLHNQPRLEVKEFHTDKDGKQKMSIEGVLDAVNVGIHRFSKPKWAATGLGCPGPLHLSTGEHRLSFIQGEQP